MFLCCSFIHTHDSYLNIFMFFLRFTDTIAYRNENKALKNKKKKTYYLKSSTGSDAP